MKWLLTATMALLLMAAATAWLLQGQYQQFLVAPLNLDDSKSAFSVEPGMTGRAVVERLASRNATEWNWQWRWLLRSQTISMKAGEYLLEPGLTPLTLLAKLHSGSVIFYRFTIVEGWTARQMLQALQLDPLLGFEAEEIESITGFMAELTAADNPEGWFLPETYQFARGYDARTLLKRAHEDMQEALQVAWDSRMPDLPVSTPYELLILASIIERETAVEAERTEVSGVFVRRLQTGMRLQTDPTVIYGLGDAYDGDIRKRDLQTDTPYNTYTRHGLPPTPIALPSRASLLAAAQPKPGTSLYFVADGQGGHTFSDTLEDHQKAVNIMLGRNP